MRKQINPFISANFWSYIINQNGNVMRIILEGYGSCTPIDKLKEWISKLSQKEINNLADECDKRKDILD